MLDESVNISAKTWTRTVDNISKVGYSDGVIDGQNNSMQTSFDMGYSQGLKFGLDLGYKSAVEKHSNNQCNIQLTPTDPCKINCQICLDQINSQDVINLFNIQKEKNDMLINKTTL